MPGIQGSTGCGIFCRPPSCLLATQACRPWQAVAGWDATGSASFVISDQLWSLLTVTHSGDAAAPREQKAEQHNTTQCVCVCVCRHHLSLLHQRVSSVQTFPLTVAASYIFYSNHCQRQTTKEMFLYWGNLYKEFDPRTWLCLSQRTPALSSDIPWFTFSAAESCCVLMRWPCGSASLGSLTQLFSCYDAGPDLTGCFSRHLSLWKHTTREGRKWWDGAFPFF